MRAVCNVFILIAGVSLYAWNAQSREVNPQIRGTSFDLYENEYDDCEHDDCGYDRSPSESERVRHLKESVVAPPVYSKRPVYTSKKPVYTSKKPVYTSKKPVYTSKKPVYTSKKPVYTSKKPVYGRFLKSFAPQYISSKYAAYPRTKAHYGPNYSSKYPSKVYSGRRLQKKGYVPVTPSQKTYYYTQSSKRYAPLPSKKSYPPPPPKKSYIPTSKKSYAPPSEKSYVPVTSKKSYVPVTSDKYVPVTPRKLKATYRPSYKTYPTYPVYSKKQARPMYHKKGGYY